MKTKYWIVIFSSFAVLCSIAAYMLFFRGDANQTAEVSLNGAWVMTLDLTEDNVYPIENEDAYNVLTVQDGKIAVTAASCMSQDCVHQGWSDHGAPIVCLPNRLVITFRDSGGVDAVVG